MAEDQPREPAPAPPPPPPPPTRRQRANLIDLGNLSKIDPILRIGMDDADDFEEGKPKGVVLQEYITESYCSWHSSNHYEPIITQKGITKEELAKCHHCQLLNFSKNDKYPIFLKGPEEMWKYFVLDSPERGNRNTPVLPANFAFIEESILGEGVERADADFRSGCDCADDDQCMDKGCTCLQDMDKKEGEEGEDGEEERKREEKRAKRTTRTTKGKEKMAAPKKTAVVHKYAYTYDPLSGRELLRDEILDSREPIYECHSGCACSPTGCRNRVVERGRKVTLDLFRTKDGRGFGVQSRRPIKRGQFVDKYIGEIITPEEAERRRAASAVVGQKDIYLFALDKFTNPNSHDPRLCGPPLEVDGEYFSGPTRFINHSCEPNLRIFARVGDYSDKHIHDLAFFAIRDIPAETELTFDYVDGNFDRSIERGDDVTKCICGADDCRQYLW